MIEMNKILIQIFVESHKKSPRKLILDFDGTDDRVHGNQSGGLFNGYYRHRCFLPPYVFCRNHLLTAYLLSGNVPDSKHSWAILKLLVDELRRHWPNVCIMFRRDSAFCRHKMLNWCDKNNVNYVIGIASNNRIKSIVKPHLPEVEEILKKRK